MAPIKAREKGRGQGRGFRKLLPLNPGRWGGRSLPAVGSSGAATHRRTPEAESTWEAAHACLSLGERREMGSAPKGLQQPRGFRAGPWSPRRASLPSLQGRRPGWGPGLCPQKPHPQPRLGTRPPGWLQVWWAWLAGAQAAVLTGGPGRPLPCKAKHVGQSLLGAGCAHPPPPGEGCLGTAPGAEQPPGERLRGAGGGGRPSLRGAPLEAPGGPHPCQTLSSSNPHQETGYLLPAQVVQGVPDFPAEGRRVSGWAGLGAPSIPRHYGSFGGGALTDKTQAPGVGGL